MGKCDEVVSRDIAASARTFAQYTTAYTTKVTRAHRVSGFASIKNKKHMRKSQKHEDRRRSGNFSAGPSRLVRTNKYQVIDDFFDIMLL